MRKKFNFGIALLLIGNLFFQGCLSIRTSADGGGIRERLVNIMGRQERVIGIKQYYPPPEAVYEYPTENLLTILTGIAWYDDKKNKIYISPEEDFSDSVKLELTLAHELGHYFQDRLSEETCCVSFPDNRRFKRSLDEIIGRKIVAEGIATYFERRTFDLPDESVGDLSKKKEDFIFLDKEAEFQCYMLVKDIIDKYRRRGIEFMIRNPPTISNPRKDFPEYKEFVLRALGE